MSNSTCSRRKFLSITVTGVVSSFFSRPLSAADPSNDKPNVIVVMVDNVGFAEVGINGNDKIKTPNLDRFASDGAQMERFYCNPMCAPTRASIMTGRYHYRTGVIHTSRGGAKMHGDEVTIADYLRKGGYRTGIFGKWHLGDNYPMRPQDQGFTETLVHKSGRLGQVPDKPNSYFDPLLWQNGRQVKKKGYCTNIFFDAALDFITENRDKPFFVYLPTNVAHLSREVGLEIDPGYSDPYRKMGLGEKSAKVFGMMTNVDENFGRMISKLEQLEIRENTLIIFLSDDGNAREYNAGFRGHGQPSLYEGGIRVFCFAQWPGRIKPGLKVDRIASHIDILPTVVNACGLELLKERKIDGVSLLPLWMGTTRNWPARTMFFQCHRGLTPQRYQNCAVVTQRYKMVGYPGTFNQRNLQIFRDRPILELYDLSDDMGEKHNIAKSRPEIVNRLKAKYDIWFDDVKNSRGFECGVIHLGNSAENPSYLCRYQDSTYVNQKPTGWPVEIERNGRYEFIINRGDAQEPGTIHVHFNGTEFVKPLRFGENKAVFELKAGKGKLNVWAQQTGELYVPRSKEDTIGDVIVRWID